MHKLQIEVATSGRGFLNELYNYSFQNFEFINFKDNVEITGNNHKLLRRIYFSKLFDFLGVIQISRVNTEYDALISYNRFLFSKKPYYIICENPTALYHYRLDRKNGIFAKHEIKERIQDVNLKGIICISQACYNTFSKVIGIDCEKLYQIYPLIKDSTKINFNKYFDDKITALYVSSNFALKSGYEIIEAARLLPQINFRIVTKINLIPANELERIRNQKNIELLEFNYSKDELYEIYRQSHIFLLPTRQDSFGLVILEAIKQGLPVLATSVYAIPEMIEPGKNGFLTEPRYYFFDKNNIPNKEVWENRERTIYSHYIDQNIVKFLVEKLSFLNSNREFMKKMSEASYEKAIGLFGMKNIEKQWENLIQNTFSR